MITLGLRGSSAKSGWQDFPQYYIGAMMIRTGRPDALYPTPDPQSARNPGWFDASTMKAPAAVVWGKYSDSETNRFMSPPALAVLFVPLTYFSLPVAAGVWTAMLAGAVLALGWQAGRVYEICLGRPSRGAGVIVLIVCTSLLAHRSIRVGNVSALAAAVTGACVVLLLRPVERRDIVRSAVLLALGATLKFFTLALVPVYVLRGRSRVIWMSVMLGAGIVLVTLPATRLAAWSEYVSVILPLQNRPSFTTENQAIRELLLRLLDVQALSPAVQTAFGGVKYATLAGLLGLLYARRHTLRFDTPATCAAALTLLVWLFAFGPLFWDHYQTFLIPFWGWLLFESRRGGFMRLIAFTSIALVVCPLPAMGWVRVPEPINSHLLIGSLLMSGLAVRRLVRTSSQT